MVVLVVEQKHKTQAQKYVNCYLKLNQTLMVIAPIELVCLFLCLFSGKLARDVERRNILPLHSRMQSRRKKTPWKMLSDSHTMSANDSRGRNKLAVTVDLEDAYNRVEFKLLMELLVQYGVSLTLTRWLAAALQERKATVRLGNWISTPQQLTVGLPQGSRVSPVVYNVNTKELAGLNSKG